MNANVPRSACSRHSRTFALAAIGSLTCLLILTNPFFDGITEAAPLFLPYRLLLQFHVSPERNRSLESEMGGDGRYGRKRGAPEQGNYQDNNFTPLALKDVQTLGGFRASTKEKPNSPFQSSTYTTTQV